MEHAEIVDLPYNERRIITVTDVVAEESSRTPTSWKGVALTGLGVGGFVPGGLVAAAALKLIADAKREFRKAGESMVSIDWRAASQLRFPPGHPRKNVVYVAHPVDSGSYIPAADFHRFLFEHKVAEAQRLVRALGASEVRVVHVRGWDRVQAAELGISLPQAATGADMQFGASAERTDKIGQQVLMTMKLTPTRDPYVPDDLVWTKHEPLWQEVAAARLEAGLSEFAIDVKSSDDFGVNASMKALIEKSGLDAGGRFVEHQETVWQMTGTFV